MSLVHDLYVSLEEVRSGEHDLEVERKWYVDQSGGKYKHESR